MVSSVDDAPYCADIVRLICGDDRPEGPGFKETVIETTINGDYRGRAQSMHDGSYVVVPACPPLDDIASFTVQAMIWPTTPLKGRQALLSKWCEKSRAGFSLYIDDSGAATLCLGDGSGVVETLSVGRAMISREWYFVAASFDAHSRQLRIYQEPLADSPGLGVAISARTTTHLAGPGPNQAPFLMAALCVDPTQPGSQAMSAHYNGKIDRPRLASRALSRLEMAMLVDAPLPATLAADMIGCWDFSRDLSSTRVIDLSANLLHGETVNLPTRGMRGFNWTGAEQCWRHAPAEYGAIHFHDDDLYDVLW